MAKKLTRENFIQRVNEIHGNKYDYSKVEYINTSTKVCIICPEHGEFWQTPNKHLQGRGCPKCGQLNGNKKKTFTQVEFENKANIIHNFKYTYNNDYINDSTKIKITCPIHGDFFQTPNHHLRGQGCPKCAIEKNSNGQKMSQEEFVLKANAIHNGKYDYNKSKYLTYKENLLIICPEHGEFWQTPDSHLHGHGCPKCGNQISNGEEEILHYLESISNTEIKTRDKSVLKGKELDIYIPEKKVAIEYDGLIWHSEKFGKDRNYHLNKTIECEKQGIRLIHIFEDEWLEHKEIVKSKLKHILGCDYDLPKIYARKCSIEEINKERSDCFLKINHIQGKANASVYLGCFYKKQLIGVMLFKKTNNLNNYEMVRFATDIDYHCVGIGGKLFKYFVKNYNPNKIKSFADRRWSTTLNNTIYDELGFKLLEVLKPDYSYVNDNGNRLHKFNCRKQSLIKKYPKMNLSIYMTETEMAEKIGLYKIWNCGLLKYVWEKFLVLADYLLL